MSITHWQKIINVNLNGVINCATEVYKVMVQQQSGHIINTASVAGLVPSAILASYCTCKFAVVGFSRVLRAEGKDLGVKVSVICPGYITSKIYDNAIYIGTSKDQLLKLNPFKYIETSKAVRIILKQVDANKELIIFPYYAKLMWFLYRNCYSLCKLLNVKTLKDFRAIRSVPLN